MSFGKNKNKKYNPREEIWVFFFEAAVVLCVFFFFFSINIILCRLQTNACTHVNSCGTQKQTYKANNGSTTIIIIICKTRQHDSVAHVLITHDVSR